MRKTRYKNFIIWQKSRVNYKKVKGRVLVSQIKKNIFFADDSKKRSPNFTKISEVKEWINQNAVLS